MGRRSKHHRAQPPTTIIVPNFELTDSEARAQSPESWEGYPDVSRPYVTTPFFWSVVEVNIL
jgi:hypothetical protein